MKCAEDECEANLVHGAHSNSDSILFYFNIFFLLLSLSRFVFRLRIHYSWPECWALWLRFVVCDIAIKTSYSDCWPDCVVNTVFIRYFRHNRTTFGPAPASASWASSVYAIEKCYGRELLLYNSICYYYFFSFRFPASSTHIHSYMYCARISLNEYQLVGA